MNALSKRLGLDPRAGLGLAVIFGGLMIWVLAFTGGIQGLFSSSTHPIKADFASIEDIVKNDPVRINGVQVGTVGNETIDKDGKGATVTMNLTSTAGPIYANAGAQILWRTALGANDAISLNPGTRSAGLLGSRTIKKSQDTNQVELDQITQGAFQGDAQSGTRTLLQQMADAFAQDPPLAEDFGTLAQIAPAADIGIGALRGEVPDTDLKNLVNQAGRAAQALSVGTNASDTREFVQSAATTLTTLSDSQVDLRATIDQAGRVIPRITRAAVGVQHVIDDLNPLITKLDPIAPTVAPTLVALHPTVVDADTLLHDATPLLRKLRPTVDSLATTANVGVPVLKELNPALVTLGQHALPTLNYKDVEDGGNTGIEMVGPTLVNLGQLSDFFNQDGEAANLTAGLFNQNALSVLPCKADFTGTDLLVCESLSASLVSVLGGGTPLLSVLASKPGMSSIYGPLLQNAQGAVSMLNTVKAALNKRAPSVAKFLFKASGS